VGPGTGLDICGNSRPTGIRSPDLQARSESLYRLRYPFKGTICFICVKNLEKPTNQPTILLDGAVILETQTGPHLVKKFRTFYGTRRLIAMFTSDIRLSLFRVRPVLDVVFKFHVFMNNSEHENCAVLGYYAASSGNSLPTFRDNLFVLDP
jgi:hypothetical protein